MKKVLLTFFILISMSIIFHSCKSKDKSTNERIEPSKEVPVESEKKVDLSISDMAIEEDRQNGILYGHKGRVEITNQGNAPVDDYAVVFSWKCPADPDHVNYPLTWETKFNKTLQPGEKSVGYVILADFNNCTPKPNTIECTCTVENKSSIPEDNTANNKRIINFNNQ